MADGFEINLQGFDELERELKQLGDDAPKVLRAGIRAGAVIVRKAAQKNLEPHRDTGDLADSLKVSARIDRRKRAVTATVRNTRDTFYGSFLEFGTVHISPVRWLTRALRDNSQQALDAVAERMRRRIKAVKAKRAR